jgi:general nucleoside transport system permease protein
MAEDTGKQGETHASAANAPGAAPAAGGHAKVSPWREAMNSMAVPVLAVFTALVVSGVLILASDVAVLTAYSHLLGNPGGALAATWKAIADAYGSLFLGAIGDPGQIAAALGTYFSTGETKPLLAAFWPLSESLVTSTPYMFAGLAVALGFKCSLFNIGAEGQIYIGALAAAWIGYSVTGLPGIIHMPLAFLGGAAAAGLWGAIPGYLRAKTGAHEVINTIMMNYIAFRLADWLVNGPMKRGGAQGYIPITPSILPTAEILQFFPDPVRFHLGFFMALGFAVLVYWFLWKTTLGFEIRTVGANVRAARYSGISVGRNIVLAMALSGALAGMAGANEVLAVNHNVAGAFSPGYGFDSIALALLGNSHPLGVVLASLLFGTLRNGATRMQSVASIPVDIIVIVQAMVIMFIAAPAIIRWIYRLKEAKGAEIVSTGGWGK